jgi:hypothetical protein
MTYTVPMDRLDSGVFTGKEGDISNAYACEKLAQGVYKPGVRVKTFTHDGKLWTSGAGGGGWDALVYHCYQLIPIEQYNGPDSAPYSYEGLVVSKDQQQFRLGPKVKFVGVRTVEEHRRFLRCMYKNGGYFNSGRTYHQLLRELREKERWDPETRSWVPKTGPSMEAIDLELATPDWCKWTKEMAEPTPTPKLALEQLELALR